jgi:hypothetical protein
MDVVEVVAGPRSCRFNSFCVIGLNVDMNENNLTEDEK